LQSPRLTLAIDALRRVYDHVVLDAGTASDLPAELLSTDARAVVVTEPSLEGTARAQIGEKLKAVGFAEVAMLERPAQPADTIDPGPRVVAA
jgi:tyrosine-protein kinase Etk/Wzc